jgi:hypothetical protein
MLALDQIGGNSMADTRRARNTLGSATVRANRRRRAWPGSATTPAGSPTRPEHYAVINGVYMAGMAGIAALSRSRDAIPLHELPVIGLAAFAAADVLAKQKVTTWLREPFVEEGSDHKPVRPEGSGLGYAFGELLTCTRCVGAWCSLGLVGLRIAAPGPGRAVTSVLASTGANHFLQTGFGLLCETSNKTKAEADAARDAVPARAI